MTVWWRCPYNHTIPEVGICLSILHVYHEILITLEFCCCETSVNAGQTNSKYKRFDRLEQITVGGETIRNIGLCNVVFLFLLSWIYVHGLALMLVFTSHPASI